MKKFSLRLLAIVLAVAMLAANFVTAATALESLPADAQQVNADERETVTTTDAKIVAEYYGFVSQGEKAVLNCSAIVGDSHVIPVPADSDNLVSINAEAQTVAATTFTLDGYTWTPVKAYLVYQDAAGSDIRVPVVLDENGNGTFNTELESYSVEVDYEVKVDIDVAEQSLLVNAPAALVDGLANLEAVANTEGGLTLIANETVFEALLTLTERLPFYGSYIEFFVVDSEGYNAIKTLEADRNANGGTFALLNAIAQYKASANKVEFLLDNGSDVKAACAIADAVAVLADDVKGLPSQRSMLNMALRLNAITQDDYDNMETLIGVVKDLAAAFAEVKEEKWAVLDNSPVKADASANELEALELAVNAVKANAQYHNDVELVESLVAATTTVKAGVAQTRVNVAVNAQVVSATSINDNTLSTIAGKSANFLIADGATEDEIFDKIEAIGICAEALAYWSENAAVYNIASEFYAAEYAVAEVDGAIAVTITYVPVTFKITSDFAADMTVYYGYRYRLENHSDVEKSYDYKVNGAAKYQGEIVTISENIYVTRTEGNALSGAAINAIIANSSVKISAAAKDILNVNGFKVSGNEQLFGTLKYRLPTVATLEATAGENNYKVTAPAVVSGLLSGASWTAVSVDLLDENGAIIASYELENGSVEFTFAEAFSNARINFELVVAIGAEEVHTVANLPYVLVNEAQAQLAILDRMTGTLYSALAALPMEELNMAIPLLESNGMSAEAVASASRLTTECVDAAGNILLYNYLTAYKNAKANGGSNGLAYYYTANNAKNIKNQLSILSEIFNALCPEDENNNDRKVLTGLLSKLGYGDYVDRLDEVRIAIDDCKNIAGVNEYVDTHGASLGALAAAIYNGIGKVEAYENAGEVVIDESLICAAPDKTTVQIVINVLKGDGTIGASYKDTLTLKKGSAVENLLVEKFNALNATLTINKNYYTVTGLNNIPQGDVSIDDITSNVVVTYTPYTYTVNVPGAATQSFSYDADWTITLPAPTNNGIKLVYTVAGATVEVIDEDVRYTFTNLNAFNADRSLTVEVEEVDLAAEKFINFINMLNEAVGEVGGRFIPVEDENGNIAIVFRVSSSISSAIDTGVIANLPLALAMYSEVMLGGNTFWDGSSVHLQAMTDMVADSGFSFDRFCAVIRENGTVINDANLSKLTPMIDAQGNIGGTLMNSTITIEGKTMGFYVTLSDTTSASMLAQMRSAVATVKNYFNIVCEDGQFKFVITAPDSVYPYYLAQMLVAGNVDITDISKLTLRDSLRYEWGLIEGIITDEKFSTETIENTIAMFGKDVSLASLEGIYNNFKKANSYLKANIDVVADENMAADSYSGTFLINLNGVLNRVAANFGIDPTMMSLIHEARPDAERYEINFSVELTNLDKDYDAIVFDINGDGLTKKFYCSNNLADVLNNLGNYGIVILTSDATLSKDVRIPANAVIDLNGYTITGNISAGGTVRFVDSRLGTEDAGMVDGKLGSGDFIITGGKFTDDISKYLRTGYYVNEDGYVRNKIYSIEKNGNDIEIALSAAYINNVGIVDFQSLILDVAIDAAMSSFSTASVAIDGKDVYSFACEDITAILSGGLTKTVNSIIDIFNPEGFSYVLNSVVGKLTDFKGLASAIKNDQAIVDYELTVKNWNIVPYVAEGNYITFDAVPSNAETGRFTVVIAGSEAEKTTLADLCDDLSVVEVNAFEINLGNIEYKNGFNVDLNGEIDVHINLAKNRAYAALVCAAAAYSTNNTAKKQAYVAALVEYLSGENSTAIMSALERMTTKEMIAAFKAINNVSCEKLLTSIGINVDNQTAELVRLFGAYDQIVRIGSMVLAKLDVVGNDASLAGHKVNGTFATYKFATEVVGRVSVSLTITTVAKFGEIKVEDFGIADSVTKETVNFFRNDIELANGSVGVALDVASQGMKVRDFIALFNLDIVGALRTNIEVIDKNGALKAYDDLVSTGDTLIVTAFDGLVEYIVMERTVVIIGDTDGDGVTNSNDAYAIAMLQAGAIEMDEIARVAADINGNGTLDIGDAAKICYKAAADWADYIA